MFYECSSWVAALRVQRLSEKSYRNSFRCVQRSKSQRHWWGSSAKTNAMCHSCSRIDQALGSCMSESQATCQRLLVFDEMMVDIVYLSSDNLYFIIIGGSQKNEHLKFKIWSHGWTSPWCHASEPKSGEYLGNALGCKTDPFLPEVWEWQHHEGFAWHTQSCLGHNKESWNYKIPFDVMFLLVLFFCRTSSLQLAPKNM